MILYPTNYEIRSNAIYNKKNNYTKKEGKITPERIRNNIKYYTHSTHVYIYIYIYIYVFQYKFFSS